MDACHRSASYQIAGCRPGATAIPRDLWALGESGDQVNAQYNRYVDATDRRCEIALVSPAPTQREVLQMLGTKWVILIIAVLEDHGCARFGQLQGAVPGLGAKSLTHALRRLQAASLVTRTAYPEIPPRVEYALTDLGRGIALPLREITSWLEANFEPISPAGTPGSPTPSM